MRLNKNQLLLFYKLLEIIIFLTFFIWAVALLSENILPEFISSHLSFLKLTIFASFILILFSLLSKKLNLSFNTKIKKWQIISLAIFSFFIISLSLIKFNPIEIIIITILSFFIIFYLYKVLFKTK